MPERPNNANGPRGVSVTRTSFLDVKPRLALGGDASMRPDYLFRIFQDGETDRESQVRQARHSKEGSGGWRSGGTTGRNETGRGEAGQHGNIICTNRYYMCKAKRQTAAGHSVVSWGKRHARTFCFALDLVNELLPTTFPAYTRSVSRRRSA